MTKRRSYFIHGERALLKNNKSSHSSQLKLFFPYQFKNANLHTNKYRSEMKSEQIPGYGYLWEMKNKYKVDVTETRKLFCIFKYSYVRKYNILAVAM